MSQSRGGGTLLFFLVILTLVSDCTRPGSSGTQRQTTPSADETSTVSAGVQPPTELSSTRYVRSIALNVRSAPKGPVVRTLKQDESVQVYELAGKWARISPAALPAEWVSAPNLCEEAGCGALAPPPPLQTNLSAPTPRTQSSSQTDTSDRCPCSGSDNCFGPRGGRYCITSGGNKRYR